jgi:hypothetical protein
MSRAEDCPSSRTYSFRPAWRTAEVLAEEPQFYTVMTRVVWTSVWP